ncbi:MAG: hypothetical protein A2W91_00890 [Bacteroidetes bacterium GWF2_38_335]|nr:MAG: hypothetical protein A2W91_00890 [Bacteroidetes bacterium GWF2_38_335]OFY80311.1 MAG: hypothetical protein A2281_17400 [Bacteroidetes bacterium RIFOXYA12_FULL_38_20]HBS88889.1 hypothetical protein [Bacteroidales bacterium]
MEKIDFKKKYKNLFSASAKKITIENVPELNFLVYRGKGHPENNPEYGHAMECLFSVAYTLKFMLKFDEKIQPKGYADYSVTPVETLWYGENDHFDVNKPESWLWDCMILTPAFIDAKLIEKAKEEIIKKKKAKKEIVPPLEKLRFEKFHEKKVVQTLHIGPYGEVGEIYQKLEEFIDKNNLKCHGKAHEIYLNNPCRTAPEKLKTIVRLPVL